MSSRSPNHRALLIGFLIVCTSSPTTAQNRRGFAADLFSQLDTNHDKFLSAKELGQPVLHDKIDKDGDGKVTLTEAQAHFKGKDLPRWLSNLYVKPLDTLTKTEGTRVYWNQFRGPNGQGVMDAPQVPIHFGPDSNILWKTAVGEGQSSPVIWGNRIFFTTGSSENQGELTTVCLDREQGKVLWQTSVHARTKRRYYPSNGPASPTPATDEQHVYVYFGTYGLLCYDHNGTKVWERKIDHPENQYGVSVSPILYEDKVILVLDDNDRDSRILAMHRDTGATVWEQPRHFYQAGWATPMIWRNSGGDELVVLGSRRLTSYDPSNGKELWWAGGFSKEPIGVPVTGEDLLFASDAAAGGRGEIKWDAEASWKVTLEDFDKNKDSKIQRKEMANGFRIPLRSDLAKHEPGSAYPVSRRKVDGWLRQLDKDGDGISKKDWLEFMAGFSMESQPTLMAIHPGAHGNARPFSVAWEIHSGIPEVPSPLYHQGRIYLLRKGGRLACIRASDGKGLFRGLIGVRGQYIASPIVAGDKLITASERGTVAVIQIGDKLEVLARNEFGEKILATPAIAENKIYLRTAGHMYAIGG